MASTESLSKYMRPDGSLTAEGQALNETGQRYFQAVYAELVGGFKPSPEKAVSVPVPLYGKTENSICEQGTKRPFPGLRWSEEFMSAADIEIDWLLSGILPAGGLSLLVADPKTGKSTFTRCLALATARGAEFVGRSTAGGAVMMASFEDSDSMAAGHMKDIGLNGDDRIAWAGPDSFLPVRGARLNQLEAAIDEFRFRLVVIDSLFRFLTFQDGDSYAETGSGLHELMKIARRSGAHLMLTHHARKAGGDRGKEILGSTAIFGAVDSLVSLKRDGDGRTLSTTQRLGEDIEPTALILGADGWLTLGDAKAETTRKMIDEQMLAVLGSATCPMDTPTIAETSERSKKVVVDSLARLTQRGLIERSGSGKKGDPFLFSVFHL